MTRGFSIYFLKKIRIFVTSELHVKPTGSLPIINAENWKPATKMEHVLVSLISKFLELSRDQMIVEPIGKL